MRIVTVVAILLLLGCDSSEHPAPGYSATITPGQEHNAFRSISARTLGIKAGPEVMVSLEGVRSSAEEPPVDLIAVYITRNGVRSEWRLEIDPLAERVVLNAEQLGLATDGTEFTGFQPGGHVELVFANAEVKNVGIHTVLFARAEVGG